MHNTAECIAKEPECQDASTHVKANTCVDTNATPPTWVAARGGGNRGNHYLNGRHNRYRIKKQCIRIHRISAYYTEQKWGYIFCSTQMSNLPKFILPSLMHQTIVLVLKNGELFFKLDIFEGKRKKKTMKNLTSIRSVYGATCRPNEKVFQFRNRQLFKCTYISIDFCSSFNSGIDDCVISAIVRQFLGVPFCCSHCFELCAAAYLLSLLPTSHQTSYLCVIFLSGLIDKQMDSWKL